MLGPRERVVIVEVADTWLVLGVAPGQVSKLHELPAPAAEVAPAAAAPDGRFAERLAQALKHNLRRGASRQP
ncbi:Flagellar protein FliO [compost metagenome]